MSDGAIYVGIGDIGNVNAADSGNISLVLEIIRMPPVIGRVVNGLRGTPLVDSVCSRHELPTGRIIGVPISRSKRFEAEISS